LVLCVAYPAMTLSVGYPACKLFIQRRWKSGDKPAGNCHRNG